RPVAEGGSGRGRRGGGGRRDGRHRAALGVCGPRRERDREALVGGDDLTDVRAERIHLRLREQAVDGVVVVLGVVVEQRQRLDAGLVGQVERVLHGAVAPV